MAFDGLVAYISKLQEENQVIRVTEFVNPDLEISEITDRISKEVGGGKALLFENNGTAFPVLMNMLGSERRICIALNINNLEDPGEEILRLIQTFSKPSATLFDKLKLIPQLGRISKWIPKQIKGKGKCQENIIQNPDLSILPILKCWPYDGGKFITFPMVITKDPVTNIRNVGMYRMQVFDKKLTGMHWHLHKTGARHYAEYKKLGKQMPISVALGGDPVYTYSATAPLPDNIDEFILAGFLRKKQVKLVKCISNDIYVPFDADIIIEGFIDTTEELIYEGPFGDHTGFYSLADWYPRFHVTCITHRNNAIYPATLVGIPPQEDAWIAKATERIFLAPMKLSLAPEIIDIDLPVAGTAHNLAIIKIKKTYPGQAIKVMNALWGAGQMMFNKMMIVVDEQVDIHDYNQLVKVVADNVRPSTDVFLNHGPSDVLDHASYQFSYSGKLGIDATNKLDKIIEKKENSTTIEPKDFVYSPEIIFIKYLYEYNSLIVFVDTIKFTTANDTVNSLLQNEKYSNVKFLIILNSELKDNDLDILTWIGLANFDPAYDVNFFAHNKYNKVLVVNCLRKFNKMNFNRPWPNINVMDEITIKKIDDKWKSLSIGPFIDSPSHKIAHIEKTGGATVSDE